MSDIEFKDVKAIWEGGTGVPQSHYLLTYRGEIITSMYAAQDALRFVLGRGPGWAIISVVEDKHRVVHRNPATMEAR